MLTTTAHLHNTETSGTGGTSSFTILGSAAAFQILSSGLYSDKITAVIRELSCNAWDAHKAIGSTEPIKLHLPTSLEPFFSVTDKGIGLDHEGVTHLYTTYFGSTKNDSNDYIGALGLGSKSPFAYTTGFTVVSTYNGKVRTYSATLTEEGIPQITIMDEDETDEPNGVSVTMPVKSYDMQEFRSKAAKVLEFFPTVETNLRDFTPATTVYTHKGTGWGVRNMRKDAHLYNSKPRAIQGMVAYTFPLDQSKLTEEQQAVLSLPIDLFFNIGELDVAASRETLSMNVRTTASIANRLQAIHDEIVDSLKDEIAVSPSIWQAKLVMKDRLAHNSPFKGLIRSTIKKFYPQYMDFLANDVNTVIKLGDYPNLTMHHRSTVTRRGSISKATNLTESKNYRGEVYIETSETVTFWLNDTSTQVTRVSKRILEEFLEEGEETLYIITPNPGADPKLVSEEFLKLTTVLGDPNVKFTSDLPPVPKQSRAKATPSDTCKFAWIYNSTRYGSQSENWKKAKTEDITGEGPFLYVPLDRLEIVSSSMSIETLYRVWNALKILKITLELPTETLMMNSSTVLFGLNTKGVERIIDNPAWVNLETFLKNPVNELDIPTSYLSYLSAQGLKASFPTSIDLFSSYIDGLGKNASYYSAKNLVPHLKGTEFHRQAVMVKRITSLVERLAQKTPAADHWAYLLDFTKQSITVKAAKVEDVTKLQKMVNVDIIKNRYPMLQFVENTRYMDSQKLQHISNYVKAQDALAQEAI